MSYGSREELKDRIRKLTWQYAIYRPESALTIALTLIGTAIGIGLTMLDINPLTWLPWVWLAGGTAAEAAILYTSLTDPKVSQKIVEEMFRQKVKPERITDKELQKQINEALDYRGRIAAIIAQKSENVLKSSLEETLGQIDEWITEMYDLAYRLDEYRKQKATLDKSNARAHERRQQLQLQLKTSQDPAVQRDIQANIDSLNRQIETNQVLQNTMERARLRLDNTVTAMSTIYSQTMLFGAKDIDSGRAQRLSQDIADEVNELGDILEAMNEVYAQNR